MSKRWVCYLIFFYYQCLNITIRISLAINTTVQRLDINGALDILRWDIPLFKCIDDYYVSLFYCLFLSFQLLLLYLLIWIWFLVLNWTNFKDWKENMQIVLGCMDLDLALRIEKPPSPMDLSNSQQEETSWEVGSLKSHEVFRGTISMI